MGKGSLLLCKMGLTTSPTSRGACGRTEKYCLNELPCCRLLEGENYILPSPAWPESTNHWAFMDLGEGIRSVRHSEATRDQNWICLCCLRDCKDQRWPDRLSFAWNMLVIFSL